MSSSLPFSFEIFNMFLMAPP